MNDLDYTMTPDRIIAAIESMPQLSDDDAARILDALRESFPTLAIFDAI